MIIIINIIIVYFGRLLHRRYAANIRRPYDVMYDPFTQSIQVLDNKDSLVSVSQQIKSDITALGKALNKIERLTVQAWAKIDETRAFSTADNKPTTVSHVNYIVQIIQ